MKDLTKKQKAEALKRFCKKHVLKKVIVKSTPILLEKAYYDYVKETR